MHTKASLFLYWKNLTTAQFKLLCVDSLPKAFNQRIKECLGMHGLKPNHSAPWNLRFLLPNNLKNNVVVENFPDAVDVHTT